MTGIAESTPAASSSPPRAPAGVGQPEVTLDGLSAADARAMRAAAVEVAECRRVLTKAGMNVVGELLRGHDTFYEDDHYPTGDVFDGESGSQYYYHAHRGIDLEHGHFHTFLRGRGLLAAGADAVSADADRVPDHGDLVHLVGISMDPWGDPMALFATNRWVTGERWLPAQRLLPLLDNFVIDHAWPSWPVNRWISALLRLFRPQVRALLEQRDAVIESWRRRHPDTDVFEDTRLELTGWIAIDPAAQLAALDARFDAPGNICSRMVRGQLAR